MAGAPCQAKADGVLAGWDKLKGLMFPTQGFCRGRRGSDLPSLLGLLVAFIGEELTFRLLREIFGRTLR